LGLAAAPTWSGFLADGSIVRGFASQLRTGAETSYLGVFGLELRPEWDKALGVFRIPLTLSWGPNDKFRLFAGPVLSFGEAVLETEDGKRRYGGGSAWIGAAGLTVAPFEIPLASGNLAPYAEAAWQGYYNDGNGRDLAADFAAGFRFSTGLRYTWKL
jgi:hypothetical protein